MIGCSVGVMLLVLRVAVHYSPTLILDLSVSGDQQRCNNSQRQLPEYYYYYYYCLISPCHHAIPTSQRWLLESLSTWTPSSLERQYTAIPAWARECQFLLALHRAQLQILACHQIVWAVILNMKYHPLGDGDNNHQAAAAAR